MKKIKRPLWTRFFRKLGGSTGGIGRHPSVFSRTPNRIEELTEQLEILENLYRDAQAQALEQKAKAAWLLSMAVELSRPCSGWRRWQPYWLWQRKMSRRLARLNIFSAREYLDRYPDVATSGNNPIYHFLQHGLPEGRDGGVNLTPALTSMMAPAELMPRILASGLFDPAWYSKTHRLSGTPEDLVAHYLTASALDPLQDPGPLFSGSFYALENIDVRAVHPLEHYICYGMKEGRRAFSSSAADRFMADTNDINLPSLKEFLDPSQRTLVLYWEKGNFFFTDIARYVYELISSWGFEATLQTDHLNSDLDNVNIVVVAPHEYCVHGPGVDLSQAAMSKTVHVNTEQWHTSWFSLALDKMMISRQAVDLNPLSARGLRKLGINAGLLPLLPRAGGIFDFRKEPLSDHVTRLRAVKNLTFPDQLDDRTYDILFAGALNDRRSAKLAELAPVLAQYDCFIHAPRFQGPVTPENPNMIGSTDLANLARNSKILLNIHQGESKYFEWHRLVLSGIAQGCVPVTEPCSDIGIVKPDQHYISVSVTEMADYIPWLLGTEKGRKKLYDVQNNGRVLIQNLNKVYVQ